MKDNPHVRKMVEDAKKEGRLLKDQGAGPVTGRSPEVDDRPVNVYFLGELARTASSEAEFSDVFRTLAERFGWKAMHLRTVRIQRADGSVYYETAYEGDGKGEFDWQLLRDCLLKVELKFGKGKPTPEQMERLADYKLAGVEAYIWWPADWDEIVRRLGRPQ
jgi:hypothetical protein